MPVLCKKKILFHSPVFNVTKMYMYLYSQAEDYGNCGCAVCNSGVLEKNFEVARRFHQKHCVIDLRGDHEWSWLVVNVSHSCFCSDEDLRKTVRWYTCFWWGSSTPISACWETFRWRDWRGWQMQNSTLFSSSLSWQFGNVITKTRISVTGYQYHSIDHPLLWNSFVQSGVLWHQIWGLYVPKPASLILHQSTFNVRCSGKMWSIIQFPVYTVLLLQKLT